MELKYTLSEYSKETEKVCDEARKAAQDLLFETAKIISPISALFIWIICRFYKKTVIKLENGKFEISYNFYLLKQ